MAPQKTEPTLESSLVQQGPPVMNVVTVKIS